jgi:hypothetical protein
MPLKIHYPGKLLNGEHKRTRAKSHHNGVMENIMLWQNYLTRDTKLILSVSET